MSIVRPNSIAGIVEEHINTPGTSSNSEIFLDTTQGILLGTSQENDKQEFGGLIQGEPHSSEQKNSRKRASPETEDNNSIKKAKLSDNSRKKNESDDIAERVKISDKTKENLEFP